MKLVLYICRRITWLNIYIFLYYNLLYSFLFSRVKCCILSKKWIFATLLEYLSTILVPFGLSLTKMISFKVVVTCPFNLFPNIHFLRCTSHALSALSLSLSLMKN